MMLSDVRHYPREAVQRACSDAERAWYWISKGFPGGRSDLILVDIHLWGTSVPTSGTTADFLSVRGFPPRANRP